MGKISTTIKKEKVTSRSVEALDELHLGLKKIYGSNTPEIVIVDARDFLVAAEEWLRQNK